MLGTGLLRRLPELLAAHCPASRYAIVTDSTLAASYGKQALAWVEALAPGILIVFPAGEWNKTRETWATLTDRLLRAHYGRDSAIIALGGGVVGDVAGFVAATYLRGVPYVQVPTSLLAMIDSSIGGKTGVDTQFGKNLVGAFHQPALIVADLETLASLPPAHLPAGLAEALKHAVIADAEYFDALIEHSTGALERDVEVLHRVVRRSAEIKARVVAEDEQEHGKRAILNFGHTAAHALEAATGYQMLHGEAVAVGMLAEAELGARMNVTDEDVAPRLRAALEACRLPTAPTADADPRLMLRVLQQDKKTREGTVRFALPRRIGEVARGPAGEWTVAASEHAVAEMLRGIG